MTPQWPVRPNGVLAAGFRAWADTDVSGEIAGRHPVRRPIQRSDDPALRCNRMHCAVQGHSGGLPL
uniref:Uncharacterized protein n=1 Tax=blood disease bacterium R229 TaxID=741978 RepID=G2ZJE5_9RALS|nr:conserved hypothetical protein [blood disease bacterium R229]